MPKGILPGWPGIRPSAVLTVCLIVMAFWMRGELANGFQVVLGNGLDGRIQVSLAEHWLNVFRGIDHWNAPPYFYPWGDTLGYNDGYLLFGVIAAAVRLCGADPFLAFNAASAAVVAVGFLSCVLLAVEALGMGTWPAVLAATVFTIADNAACQRGHAQLLTVAFAPLLGWLVCRCLRASKARADLPALAWGLAAALLYSAWLLTSFYMLWFTTFFTALLLASLLALRAAGNPGQRRVHWRSIMRWPLLSALALGLLGLVPFVAVYLPKAAETGAHPFEEVLFYSPSLPDLLHFGADNWLFGSLDLALTTAFRPDFLSWSEHLIGYPPFLIIFGLAGAAAALFGGRQQPWLWRGIALATILSFSLVVHVRGHTLWYGVFALVPGASAIRVTSRFVLFLDLPLSLLAAYFLARAARRWPRWLRLACMALLILEEPTSFSALALNRNEEMRLLGSVPPAPATCEAFFVTAPWPRPTSGNAANDALYTHNVDAMILSAARSLPTVNGIASFNPPDWAFAASGPTPYGTRVQNYVRGHALSGVCAIDLAAGLWTVKPFP